MRPRKVKLPLSLATLCFLMEGSRPYTLKELSLSFAEPSEEVEEMLRVGVAEKAFKYYPKSRKNEARYELIPGYQDFRAGRREPLGPFRELKYDLFLYARLNQR
jgi:hypothetical protein